MSPSQPTAVPVELLTPAFLEDLKTRVLFVAEESVEMEPMSQPKTSRDVDIADENILLPEDYNEAEDVRLMLRLQERDAHRTTASDLRIRVSSNDKSGKGTIFVPGWVRESATEVFFEPGNEDEPSLVEAILTTLHKVSRSTSFPFQKPYAHARVAAYRSQKTASILHPLSRWCVYDSRLLCTPSA